LYNILSKKQNWTINTKFLLKNAKFAKNQAIFAKKPPLVRKSNQNLSFSKKIESDPFKTKS
jgi:hypothetical protein